MMSNVTKKAILRALLEGVLTDLMVQTKADNVYLDDTTTVAAKLGFLASQLSMRLGGGESPPEGLHNKLIIKGDDHNEQG